MPMKTPATIWNAACLAILSTAGYAAEDKKVTFADDVFPILENKCVNCHNADEAKGGLDLSSFSATLSGGSGGEVVTSQDPGSSRLYTLAAHTEEPIMPPKGSKADDKELKIISDWIAGGLLETKSSKARISDKPKVDFDSITATGKPEGPPAMPEHLLLQPEVLTERPNAVPALAHSPWAPIVAVAGQKQVLLFHSEDYDLLGVLPYPEGFPQTLSFSPNGAYLSCGGGRAGKSGNVVAWDIKTGERIIEVGKEYDIVLGADVSPDLKNAVLGGPKRNIKLWDTVAGEQLNSIKKHPDWLLTAAYSPDGVIFATGGRNGGLYVWEAATGYEFYTLKGHEKAVTDVAWRPDGNVLASCSEDGQIMLWEMTEGKQIKKWAAHSGGAQSVTFSPDGKIASVGRDKRVKIWEGDGKLLKEIVASNDVVLSVAFSHDSKRVFTGDWHGNVKAWDISSGAELATIEPNPPTIDAQLAYSEKRIGELTGELPKLEKGIEVASKELSDARNVLNEVNKKVGEATKTRDGAKGAVAKYDGQVKALTPQVEAAKKAADEKNAQVKALTEEISKVSANLKPQQDAVAKITADLKNRETALANAGSALKAAKAEAEKPALDAEQQKKHDQLAAARAAAEKEKQAADAAVTSKTDERAKLAASHEEAKKQLASATGEVEPAKKAKAQAEAAVKAATAEKAKVDAELVEASKGGKTPPMELVDRQMEAATKLRLAEMAAKDTAAALAKAEANVQSADGKVKSTLAAVQKVDGELAKLKEAQTAKNNAFAAAEAAFKPLRDAAAAGKARAEKAKTDLAAKTKAHQEAEKAVADRKKNLDDANKALASTQATVEDRKKKLAAAQAAAKTANEALAAKSGELNSARKSLADAQAQLKNAEGALAALTKEKEGAAAKVAAIQKKEAETKKSIELAKAELKDSQFLLKKWQAAAINLTAHQEEEKVDDMTFELEDMMEEETVAKQEAEEAKLARLESEKKLENAKKEVDTGTKTLAQKSTEILERALKLVSSRAIADLKEEAGQISPAAETSTTLVAASDTEESATTDLVDDPMAEEDAEIKVVAAEALSYKSNEEIGEEVASLRQRLNDLEKMLASTYVEADKTKAKVEQFSKVAQETPKEIADRTKAEQAAAKELGEAEAERKRQEQALEAQKKRIDELRQKYLATLPERESTEVAEK